jgi:uncharacterized protein YpmS
MRPKERSFYNEMDQSHEQNKEKTLPFWKLTLFFLFLIVGVEIILFSFGKAIKNAPDTGFSVKGIANSTLDLVSSKESGDEVETIISQGVLCKNLAKNIKKEVVCSIDPEGIIVSGKISDFLPGNAAAYITPKVENGKIRFEVTKLTIGSIAVSKWIAGPVSAGLSKAVSSSLPLNQEVKRIDLMSASMVVITSKKIQ